jgi:hypothetical protein
VARGTPLAVGERFVAQPFVKRVGLLL